MKRLLLVVTGKWTDNCPNLGAEVVKQQFEDGGYRCDMCSATDVRTIKPYDVIGFSVCYVTGMIDVMSFLKKNNIDPTSANCPVLIGGGAGFIGVHLLDDCLDYICEGEGEPFVSAFVTHQLPKTPHFRYLSSNTAPVVSPPIFATSHAIVEIARGCTRRCKFCSYAYNAGKYREKSWDMLQAQIYTIRNKHRVTSINFLASNIGSFSKLRDLVELCFKLGIKIQNNDMRIDDYLRYEPQCVNTHQKTLFDTTIMKPMVSFIPTLSVGLESFDENCRRYLSKGITDAELEKFIDITPNYTKKVHYYLMWGLPHDNYNTWLETLERIMAKANDQHMSVDIGISDFQPMPKTPMENEPEANIDQKLEWVTQIARIVANTWYTPKATQKKIEENPMSAMMGKFGHLQGGYRLIMDLFRSKPCDLTRFVEMGSLNAIKQQYALKYNHGNIDDDPDL